MTFSHTFFLMVQFHLLNYLHNEVHQINAAIVEGQDNANRTTGKTVKEEQSDAGGFRLT